MARSSGGARADRRLRQRAGGVTGGGFEGLLGADGARARRPQATGALARAARLPAWTITALLGLAYVIAAPPSADLAAASYRSYLFGREGFTPWDNAWYGGHHLPR